MDTVGTASGVIIDGLLLVCLLVAITVGVVLLMQIMKLRRERFKFDQMTQALAGQMAIFQGALASGKEDIEVKIVRMNKAIDQARDLADELHILLEAGNNLKSAPQHFVQEQPQPQPQQRAPQSMAQQRASQPDHQPSARSERPMFAIIDPEFAPDIKEDSQPLGDDFADLTATDRAELAQLATPAEKALMAALKRAGRR